MEKLKWDISAVTFSINGKLYEANEDNVTVTTSLNTFIRDYANLKGTKYMCKEGGCGSCIVSVQSTHPVTKKDYIFSVNSCLVPVLACHGYSIFTIESLGDRFKGYHPLQTRLAAFNGTQCGFCTPGMIMNMYSLWKNNPKLTMQQVENSFGGNICRCTGYRPILDAFKSFAVDATPKLKQICADIEDLTINSCDKENCKENCEKCPKNNQENIDNDDININDFIEIALAPKCLKLEFSKENSQWFKVQSVLEIFQVFDLILNKSYMLLAGNTAQGVYPVENPPQIIIDIKDVTELRAFNIYGEHIDLGANMTLTEVYELFMKISKENPLMFGYTQILADHIDMVAHPSVRNIGSLSGNLSIKHEHREFPSDIFLLLETITAHLEIHDPTGILHVVTLQEYLSLNMFHKVITKVIIPALSSNHYYLRTYKIMPRSQNVHALVNAGFLFRFNANNNYMVEEKPSIVFGGINKDFVHAKQTENFLIGRPLLAANTIRKATSILLSEINPDFDPTDASPAYKRLLAIGLFYRYLLSINSNNIDEKLKSGSVNLQRLLSSGQQYYDTNKSCWPITKPIQKLEALIQCSGEAEYINDMPQRPGELYGALVITDRATCDLASVDPSAALRIPGVVAFYTAKDIPMKNSFIAPDSQYLLVEYEELFCSGKVQYAGQPVGILIAVTQDLAVNAANNVKITYSNEVKPMLTIKDVLNSKQTGRIQLQQSMDPTETGRDVQYKIKGEYEIESQYHYTLELQTCLVEPIEDGLNVYSSTQHLQVVQSAIAAMLGIQENSINMQLRRVGGAYGSKVTRSAQIATATALAAFKLNRPVRSVVNLYTNMKAVGKRLAAVAFYEIGVNASGKIQYLTINMYENFGNSMNDNMLRLTLEGLLNCYDYSTWRIKVYSVLTDIPSNTWTRAPGTLEAMSTIEHIMEHIAYVTKIDPVDVRKVNLFNNYDSTIREMIQTVQSTSSYHQRKQYVQQFNVDNRWKKRGIATVPMAFNLDLQPNFYSMVSIYHYDGTVAITTGGVEIGQGINTKVAQICAYVFGISINMIKLKPNSNLISPNNYPTVASMTTDTVCYATLKACEELQRRLKPIRDKMKNPTWLQLLQQASEEAINLNASYMFDNKQKDLINYIVFGVTITEVEVDVLTGQYQILRVDILEDAGESLNPLLDIGQVEGAFTMGIGYFQSEKLAYDPNTGALLTFRTWTYWPPGAKDIPIDWRVTLRKKAPNPLSVLRSKATGEPPLCMTMTIENAVREALISARKDAGLPDDWFEFSQPCTFEKTLLTSGTDPKQFIIISTDENNEEINKNKFSK
ncbi:hypothetical protein O3M35_013242 [Rhynocoris fuscipes]|uniref:Aldehyde oxidase n=1 Tax=Rhynocoris fuscipes TaxID=488301 RepID=A0AAW1CGU1_9HEMI